MLIEYLVAAALLALLGLVLLSVYRTILNSLAITTGRSVVTSQFRSTLEQFGRDVQAAQAFPASSGGYTASATVLILEIPGAPLTDIVYQCAGGACTAASPGRLERLIIGTPPTRILIPLPNVTLLNFTSLTNRVTCQLGIAQTVQGFRAESKMLMTFTKRR